MLTYGEPACAAVDSRGVAAGARGSEGGACLAGQLMASNDATHLPPVTPDHRRAAAGQYERANQVIATGNFDYGIQLLLSCCKLEPANLIYRQNLRRTEKARYKNNLRG